MNSLPDREHAVTLIDEAISNGAGKAKSCLEIGITLRTYNRWVRSGNVIPDGRPTAQRLKPKNALTDLERQAILNIANSEEYKSLPPSQIVPALADKGLYIGSESTFYRVLKSADQQHHRGRSKKPTSKPISTHLAQKPNQVWCWDITWLPGPAKGIYYYLYLIIDLYSRKVVGWEVYCAESSENAAELIKKASQRENIPANETLVLHSDNGSPMKGSSLQTTLHQLKINRSFSRPRVSNDNAYVESFFRTCKYRPDYPYTGFEKIANAQAWVLKFVTWYNEDHKHSSLKFVTPNQRHDGLAEQICEKRRELYSLAKQRHPERWSGDIRNWKLIEEVWLNPEKKYTDLELAA